MFILSEFGTAGGQYALTACWLTILFLTVLIHEYGHCLMARRLGQSVGHILLWPLGGLAYVGQSQSAKDDIKVTLAGPAVHLPLALLFTLGLMAMGDPPDLSYLNPFDPTVSATSFWGLVLAYGLKIQVWLFCFNLLLPVYPLDGGRVFVAFFSTRWPARRVAYTATAFSMLATVIMAWHGMVLLAMFVAFDALQLYILAKTNTLDMHPMFHYAPRFHAAPRRKKPHLKVVKMAAPASTLPPPPELKTSPMEQDIDRILDKIRLEGMAALTAEERNLLDEHSSHLRRGG
ncbi:MAG: site-2 protease family protein [Candidatus Eremiobacterota bacterium]